MHRCRIISFCRRTERADTVVKYSVFAFNARFSGGDIIYGNKLFEAVLPAGVDAIKISSVLTSHLLTVQHHSPEVMMLFRCLIAR